MIVTETERLIIRHYRDLDREPFIEMNADPEVMAHFPKVLTKEESGAFFERIKLRLHETGKSFWAVELKEDSSFIGFTGLSEPSFEAEFTPCTEIGWRLRRQYWNKGYATEAAEACLQVGWDQYRLDEIVSMAVQQNLPSIHVMKKLGMKYAYDFDHPMLTEYPDIQGCALYKIQKS